MIDTLNECESKSSPPLSSIIQKIAKHNDDANAPKRNKRAERINIQEAHSKHAVKTKSPHLASNPSESQIYLT